jgi:arabinogalactan oligomer / maltooligosaccharide transport system permease protein
VIRRLLPILLSLAVLLPSWAAAQDAGVETVVVWTSYRGEEKTALETLVDRFNGSSVDVQIELLAIPSKAYKSRLQAAIPRGNGPDLFIEAHELVGEWSKNRLLVPALPTDTTRFTPSAIDALRYEGQLWGIPIAVKSLALYYNRDLVEQPPATMSELLEAGRAAGGDRALVYEAGEFYYHAPLLHAFGGAALGPNGEIVLDSEGVARSLTYARTMTESGDMPLEADGAMVSTLFNQGEVPFAINGPWFLGQIRGIDYGVAPLPVLDETGEPLRPFLTVEAIFRAREGKASDDAVQQAIEVFAGVDGAVLRALEGRQVPALVAARQHPSVAGDAVLSTFAAQAEAGVPMPNRPEMSVVWEPANRALRSVLSGARKAEPALVRAQCEAERYLEPPPSAANPTPYLVILGILMLIGAGLAVRASRRHQVVSRARKTWRSYLYLAPAMIGLGAVVILPFIVGASVSLFAHQGGDFTFVGLKHFGRILLAENCGGLMDPLSFWFTLAVTIAWTAMNVALHVGIGMGLALLLRDPWMKLKGVYRVLLIVPWAVPNYITALIWKGMFNTELGAINGVLGLFGMEPVAWFSHFVTSFAANLCTNTWLGFPFMMVVTLGALQAIPRDLEEAAAVDGAGAWARFRHVTLPLLKPALLPAVILGSVWTFNMFNIIYLVSAGDPDGSTEILISEAYKWAFERQSQYGYASAYALMIFGILILYTLVTKKVTGGDVT